jgi:predicted helicase
MTVTVRQLLDDLRSAAWDERDKGDRLERLIASYLRTDPLYVQKYGEVWRWSDWPDRPGSDTGIDLVARERETGELCAIRCKFYDPTHTLAKEDIDSFFTASGKEGFTSRLIVSTTDRWSKNAEDALEGQQIPVSRLRVQDLDESGIDWSQFSLAKPEQMERRAHKSLLSHQEFALQRVAEGFAVADRGKLIMACGTGKTFTSLRVAEHLVERGGSVLFLVPSISLLSQALKEWAVDAVVPLRTYAVCSDVRVGKRTKSEDIGSYDLALPATTNATKLHEQMEESKHADAITVVFSTYQSIQAISDAQKLGMAPFDLVICDEAHRTTGVTLADDDESAFVRVHDDTFLRAKKRLYMTATPRIYDDASKGQAQERDAVLCSMDDEHLFGPEFHRLGFGEAVGANLLTDYKVLVLAVDETYVSKVFQNQLADRNHELQLDDAAKIVGCWNGLSKRGMSQETFSFDTAPMRRAVAFARSIKDSQRVTRMFNQIVDDYATASGSDSLLQCEVDHVDGTFNLLQRNEKLDWLKEPTEGNICRILSNARCLSEGVDVPALDAVMFLDPRNSVVDVVQSVGRVMRRAPGKEYGYVILPIGVPSDRTPEEALKDNQKYKVVWQVLQALRAHDDRFNALINKIELNRAKDDQRRREVHEQLVALAHRAPAELGVARDHTRHRDGGVGPKELLDGRGHEPGLGDQARRVVRVGGQVPQRGADAAPGRVDSGDHDERSDPEHEAVGEGLAGVTRPQELADEVVARIGLAALELRDEVGADALLSPEVALGIVGKLEHVADPAGEGVRERLGDPQNLCDNSDRDLLRVVGGRVGVAGVEKPVDVAPAEVTGHGLVAGDPRVREPRQDESPGPGVQGRIRGDGGKAIGLFALLVLLRLYSGIDDADLERAEPLDVVAASTTSA